MIIKISIGKKWHQPITKTITRNVTDTGLCLLKEAVQPADFEEMKASGDLTEQSTITISIYEDEKPDQLSRMIELKLVHLYILWNDDQFHQSVAADGTLLQERLSHTFWWNGHSRRYSTEYLHH